MRLDNNNMQEQKNISNFKLGLKKLALAWVTVMVFALPIAGVVLTRPQPALAQGAPTIDIANLTQNLGKFIKDVVIEGLKQGAAIAFKNALKAFVSQIAYDTAVWIGSGDENQKPLLYTKDVGSYLADAGDAAAGEFLNTLFSENGYFEYDLCQPLDVDVQLYLNLAVGIAIPMSDYSDLGIQLPEADLPVVECTFSDITNNFADASLNVDFASDVAVLFIPTNNDFGVYSTAVGSGYSLGADQGEEALVDRLKGDFAAVDGKVSDYIATPGSVVEHQYFLSLDASSQPQTTYTGQLLADTIDIFTSTLISKLLERLKTGLIADFTVPNITDSLSGTSSTSGGVSAAEEKYLSFKEVPLTRGGDIDILSDLVNCPDQGSSVTNCVIDEGFHTAVVQGKTVQQALDEGLIDGNKPFGFGQSGLPIVSPEEGIPYRSTIILKHYRIIPVGWQIAAEYLRDFGGGTSVTLQDLVDAYDQCDSTDYSPYCKLVDPDWVLTSPAGICNLQGYGQNILSVRFEDDDGLDATPERPNVLRSQSCVDDQTCLKTDSDGNCIAYGYCTEEKRIYRFQGDECPEQNSSCQTYSDSNDEEVSYLRNTLNFNNCDANSVGCQWYCQVYNDINLDWQCSQNGYVYETCSSSSSTYNSTDGTCGCTADDATTCDIQEGAFKCSTESGLSCTLSEVADTTTGVDSAINFNNQVKTCDEGDADCTTYVRTATGANLIFNSSFEFFNSYIDAPEDIVRGETELTDTTEDTFGFYSAASSDPGAACEADSGTEDCIGWEKTGRVFATSDDAFDGFVAAEVVGPATLTYEFETGYDVQDRTFDLQFMSRNDASTSCLGTTVTLNGTLLENPDYTGSSSSNITFAGDATWTTNTFDPMTISYFGHVETILTLVITIPSGCSATPIILDAFDLVESDDSAEYTAYGESELISMNGEALACEDEDIGCELFTPAGGSSADAVPGQITNPLADECTGTDGFADPSCSQCNGTNSDDEFVGCDFYQEQPLTNAAPVPSLAGFTTVPTGDEREGIVQRTGYYCNNAGFEGVSCYDDADCGGTVGACVDSVSIIPSTAEVCSAQYVGCEEYTNLDILTEGGEGLEYYSYIKQCVKDTPEQRDNDEISTFVTFEGSDISGYSLRSFDLKKSNVDDGPCTNLDLYGSTAESSEAVCIDTATTQQTCTAADVGVDADCTEFIDPDTGTSYYRLKSYTITASDDCHPLRNELDGRIYYSVPSESTSCPASQNLCREYKGSAGGDVFEAINEDFEDDVWDAIGTGTVEQSSESTAAGGHSMHLSSGTASYDLFTVGDEGTVSSLDEGKTYVVEFWAKEEGGGSGLSVYFDSATSTSADATVYFVENSVNSVSGEAVSISEGDWHKYTFGPVIMPRAGEDDDQFIIDWDDGTDFYVDNIVLEESDSQYLIKNTADACTGYEGCEEYADRAGDTHYIKSFSRLCEEQFVGCEAIIDTQNSDSPFTQEFNTDNDFSSSSGPDDDVLVSEDQVVAYVNDEDNYCTASAAGCTELGQPEVDETTGYADSFTTVTYINDPDDYSSILCETDALSCDEYTSANDEIVYFKNPGDRTCEYRQETDGSDFAWFIAGTDTECPLFDDSAAPGQPMGAICDGGDRDGLFCVSDEDCPDDDTTDTDEPHCRSDLQTDSDANGYPDTGWTGTCSTAYSGCTEYQDPNTDNLVPNGGFEEDLYTYDSTNGATDESVEASDGRPDYFEQFSFFVCDTLVQSTSESHTGTDSIQIAQDGLFSSGDGIGCSVVSEERIDIDSSKTYTLSANVMVPHAFNTANRSIVSIGMYYYDADGDFIFYDYDGDGTTGDTDDYVEFNVAAAAEEIESTEDGVWIRYSGQVGNRLEFTWPSTNNVWGSDVATVQPYVYAYTPSGEALFVDNLSLTENSAYFYINDSVDGAPESDQNSCNGEIDIGDGCVAFRDVTDKDLTYLSVVETEAGVSSDYSVNSCIIGATESEDENCRFNPDTADSNVVLQVRPDRECEQWLTCKTASITTDTDGTEETTCLEIGGCDELSDNGLCSNHLGNSDPDDLDSSDDLTFRSRSGNTIQLDDLLNLSGYTTVGVDWGATDGTCDSGTNICTDGPLAGQSCDPANGDEDCQVDEIVDGYYPYEDMPQEGEDGLTNGNADLIEDGDFEEVFCTGTSDYELSFDGGTSDSDVDTVFASSKDPVQRCVVDDHCRTQQTEARFDEILNAQQQGSLVMSRTSSTGPWSNITSEFNYSHDWCSNPDAVNESWGNFSPSDATTLISVIEYDPSVIFENPNNVFAEDTQQGGSLTLDLDNVLFVNPSGSGEGVDYAIDDPDPIINENQYSASFLGAWAAGESFSSDDHVNIGIEWEDGSKDFFKHCSDDGCGQTGVELTSEMTSYALTLTPSNKPDDSDTATLFIHGNSDSAFVIDDLSMLPTLEVSHGLSNIARECRAYPAEDALQCNYNESNGSVYRGVHGYCIENDGLFTDKCITWWPVDAISGDADSRNKAAAGYDGRVNVYYCAVAKGLEDLMVCDGGSRDGAFCSGLGTDADAYCQGSETTGECVAGYRYYDINSPRVSSRAPLYSESRDGADRVSIGESGYHVITRQIYVALGENDGLESSVTRTSLATPFEQAITVSDINNMEIYFDLVSQDPVESIGEWPAEGNHYTLGDTGDGEISDSGSVTADGSTAITVSDYTDDGTDSGTVNGTKCGWDDVEIDEDGNGSVKWIWESSPSGNDPDFCDSDPFNTDIYLWPSDIETVLEYDGSQEAVSYYEGRASQSNLVAFNFVFANGVLDYIEYIVDSETGDDDIYFGIYIEWYLNETCSLAVQAVDEDGNTTAWVDRLTSASTFALPNTDYTYSEANSPYGSVHSSLTGTPDTWNGSGLTSGDPTPFDIGDEGTLLIFRDSETAGSGLPFACIGKCSNSMCAEYDDVHGASLGYGGTDQECNADESFSCADNTGDICLGVDGNTDYSAAGISTTYFDASGSFQVEGYADQLHAAMNVARDDLSLLFPELQGSYAWVRNDADDNSLARSRDAMENLWEDFGVENIFDEIDLCSGTRGDGDYCAIRPAVNSIEVNGQIGNVDISEGESIRLNFGTEADDNQVPITNIHIIWEGIDGNSWDQDEGSVDSTNDAWMAAPSTDHVYSHAYVCDEDETNPNWESLDDSDGDGFAGVCMYEIRIQVQDSWDFCSGLQDAGSYSDYRDTSSTECNSYDEFSGYVIVTPS